jgi:hypothetical protein
MSLGRTREASRPGVGRTATPGPRAARLALGQEGTRFRVGIDEAPASPTTDLAAARRALRILAKWMVAQAREAEEPSQARQDPPDSAPQPPPREVLDFEATQRSDVTR